MLVFPQLSTGAVALYPIYKRISARTVTNVLADGQRLKYSDPDWSGWTWELRASGLTRNEWNAIEALHGSAGGRLQTFTFLDPCGNLLVQSESFDSPEWDNGPLTSFAAGIDDPFGGSRAVRVSNNAHANQVVAQPLPIPGDFRYSLTVWARAAGSNVVSLFASTAGGSVSRMFQLTSEWMRLPLLVNLGQETDSVTFGVDLPDIAVVDLFGMQVEAQLAPSAYRGTGSQGGVFVARFADDSLSCTARGTDVYDAVIRIVSKGS